MKAGIEIGTEAGRAAGREAGMGLGMESEIGASMGSAELVGIGSREGAYVVVEVDKSEVLGGEAGLDKTDVESVVGSIGVWGSIIGVATKGKGSRQGSGEGKR